MIHRNNKNARVFLFFCLILTPTLLQTLDQFITNPSNSPVAFDPSSSFLDLLKTNKRQVRIVEPSPVVDSYINLLLQK